MKANKGKYFLGAFIALALLAGSVGLFAITDNDLSAEGAQVDVTGSTGIKSATTDVEAGSTVSSVDITVVLEDGYGGQINVLSVDLGGDAGSITEGITVNEKIITVNIGSDKAVGTTFTLVATAEEITLSISGTVTANDGVKEGFTVTLDGQYSDVTDADGKYKIENIPYGKAGELTVAKEGYSAQPLVIEAMTGDLVDKDFAPMTGATYSISGQISGIDGDKSGFTVTFSDGNLTATTDAEGRYIIENVPYGASGTLTVAKDGYNTDPASIDIDPMTGNVENQNFTASQVPGNPVVDIDAQKAAELVSGAVDGVIVISTEDEFGITSAELSAASVQNLKDALTSEITAITFRLPGGIVITMTADEFNQIQGSLTFAGTEVEVPEELRDVVPEGSELYDFNALDNGSDISGPFEVSIDVSPENEDVRYRVWCINDDGTKTEVSVNYSVEDGVVTFTADHFSYYAVEAFVPENDGFPILAVIGIVLIAVLIIVGAAFFMRNRAE